MGGIPDFLRGHVDFKSDIYGTRFAIIDHRLFDMSGWKIEVDYKFQPIREFTREITWWGGDPGTCWSGLGFGEPMKPWSAWCDHDERIVRWIPPDTQ